MIVLELIAVGVLIAILARELLGWTWRTPAGAQAEDHPPQPAARSALPRAHASARGGPKTRPLRPFDWSEEEA